MVPTFVFLSAGGAVEAKVEGANPPEIAAKAAELESSAGSGATAPANATKPPPLDVRLGQLISAAPVMLFMKGSAGAPKCGFSRQVVEILNEEAIQFGTFDILADEEVRQGLKKFSNWPTYPQLYVDGELVGGCDIIEELYDTQELAAACGVGA